MMNDPLTVSLSAPLPDARIAGLTRDLERDLNRQGIKAQPVETAPAPGEKGEPITLGVLALALVTGGSIKALIECLKAYVSREPSLTFKLTRPDGAQVEVNARNVDAVDVRATLEAVASGRRGESTR
jgi:hypothetical protein